MLQESLNDFVHKNNIDINSIKEVGSIEVKKDEKAIIDLSKKLNVPFKIISKEDISKVDYLFEKSEWVKKSVGVYSVAEPVAYILSNGNLIIEKNKYKGITFSIGRVEI
ncbi:MAG: cobalamin biosynthesis protein [Peptostreptococcaceae bacterium]